MPPSVPFHGAVNPCVEYDQSEKGEQGREEEIHVLLVNLVVMRI